MGNRWLSLEGGNKIYFIGCLGAGREWEQENQVGKVYGVEGGNLGRNS